MLRHVIVEGPDGAGKTTLVDFLCASTPLVRHARASDSLTGPVANLGEWYRADFATMDDQPPSVYDRHPLISEPIYARHVRHEWPREPFDNSLWVNRHRQDLATKAYVIWCLPPFPVIWANVRSVGQMPGVVDNIHDAYYAYRRLANSWPGRMTWYNYGTQDLTTILDRVKNVLNGAFNGSSRGDVLTPTEIPGTTG